MQDLIAKLYPIQRLRMVFEHYAPEDILVTTSFGTTSAVLLSMLAEVAPSHPVYFLDTGYHFEETLRYGEALCERLKTNVVHVKPDATDHAMTAFQKLWKTDPDGCCAINKVNPMNKLTARHQIWISGLMGDQNEFRSQQAVWNKRDGEDFVRFYPLIDMPQSDAFLYLSLYKLPFHPLFQQGYQSVGCTHCTQPGTCRMGRWAAFEEKKECGLHL